MAWSGCIVLLFLCTPERTRGASPYCISDSSVCPGNSCLSENDECICLDSESLGHWTGYDCSRCIIGWTGGSCTTESIVLRWVLQHNVQIGLLLQVIGSDVGTANLTVLSEHPGSNNTFIIEVQVFLHNLPPAAYPKLEQRVLSPPRGMDVVRLDVIVPDAPVSFHKPKPVANIPTLSADFNQQLLWLLLLFLLIPIILLGVAVWCCCRHKPDVVSKYEYPPEQIPADNATAPKGGIPQHSPQRVTTERVPVIGTSEYTRQQYSTPLVNSTMNTSLNSTTSSSPQIGSIAPTSVLNTPTTVTKATLSLGLQVVETVNFMTKQPRLMVSSILSNGPAARSKLECGDILLLWDDITLQSVGQLQWLETTAVSGQPVNLTVERHQLNSNIGNPHWLTLFPRHLGCGTTRGQYAQSDRDLWNVLGLSVGNQNTIVAVDPTGPADAAGVQVGWTIIGIDSYEFPTDLAALQHVVAEIQHTRVQTIQLGMQQLITSPKTIRFECTIILQNVPQHHATPLMNTFHISRVSGMGSASPSPRHVPSSSASPVNDDFHPSQSRDYTDEIIQLASMHNQPEESIHPQQLLQLYQGHTKTSKHQTQNTTLPALPHVSYPNTLEEEDAVPAPPALDIVPTTASRNGTGGYTTTANTLPAVPQGVNLVEDKRKTPSPVRQQPLPTDQFQMTPPPTTNTLQNPPTQLPTPIEEEDGRPQHTSRHLLAAQHGGSGLPPTIVPMEVNVENSETSPHYPPSQKGDVNDQSMSLHTRPPTNVGERHSSSNQSTSQGGTSTVTFPQLSIVSNFQESQSISLPNSMSVGVEWEHPITEISEHSGTDSSVTSFMKNMQQKGSPTNRLLLHYQQQHMDKVNGLSSIAATVGDDDEVIMHTKESDFPDESNGGSITSEVEHSASGSMLATNVWDTSVSCGLLLTNVVHDDTNLHTVVVAASATTEELINLFEECGYGDETETVVEWCNGENSPQQGDVIVRVNGASVASVTDVMAILQEVYKQHNNKQHDKYRINTRGSMSLNVSTAMDLKNVDELMDASPYPTVSLMIKRPQPGVVEGPPKAVLMECWVPVVPLHSAFFQVFPSLLKAPRPDIGVSYELDPATRLMTVVDGGNGELMESSASTSPPHDPTQHGLGDGCGLCVGDAILSINGNNDIHSATVFNNIIKSQSIGDEILVESSRNNEVVLLRVKVKSKPCHTLLVPEEIASYFEIMQ